MSSVINNMCGALNIRNYPAKGKREDDRYPDFPDEPTRYCEECEFCKNAKRFVQEIVTREADGKQVLKTTDRYCFMDLCVKDIDNIKEVHGWDEICNDHGELCERVEI